MPFEITCPDHPGVTMENVEDTLRHASMSHDDGRPVQAVLDEFTTRFVPQAVAQGNPTRHHFACRRCGRMVNTDDPTRAATPYCTDCMGVVT